MKGNGFMDENVKVWNPSRHEIRESRKRREAKRFVRQNKDIIMNAAIVLVVAMIASIVTGWRTTVKLKKEFEVELMSERFRVEQEVSSRMRSEYGVDEAEAEALVMQEEAKTIAKMLYPMRNNTDLGLKSTGLTVNGIRTRLRKCAHRTSSGWDGLRTTLSLRGFITLLLTLWSSGTGAFMLSVLTICFWTGTRRKSH